MSTHPPHRLIPDSFTAVPSTRGSAPRIEILGAPSGDIEALGVLVGSEGAVPAILGVDRDLLTKAGFSGAVGDTLILTGSTSPLLVAVGAGPDDKRTGSALRDCAAAFARTAAGFSRLGLDPGEAAGIDEETLGRVITEGVLLARYRYTELKTKPAVVPVERLEIIANGRVVDQVRDGIATGTVLSVAENLARDLANTPAGHLTATEFGEVAVELAPRFGLTAEVFDKQQLIELGCGGLLGVNAGSAEEPRMIVLRYRPDGEPTGHLGLVGKGIMYDSGGISLKPSDAVHFAMKMDMSGAAAILGAMTALRDLGCGCQVTGWLMCTDNMPGGSATQLGDVLTARNGTTVEVRNTDAEGRLVMMDALALAAEEKVDAIVDIATLTGAALRALGPACAVLLGNDQPLVDEVLASARRTDEQACQFPLEHKYRDWLDSEIADICNLGGVDAGSTTAALFLEEFVAGRPWAHIDMLGTMRADRDDAWRSKGATGYGARLLADLAVHFSR
jgi:leucyl aminopeptidase